MADTFKEVIEVALKATTDPNLRTLLTTLRDLGASGDLTADQLSGLQSEVGQLVTELRGVGDAAQDAAKLDALRAATAQTAEALDAMNKAAVRTKLDLLGIEKPTREMQRVFRDAEKEVRRLEAQLASERTTLAALESTLRTAGVNTDFLADEQARLRVESERTVSALRSQAAAVQAQAQANRDLRARLNETDEAFRRQATTNRTSAEALQAYRDRAAQARTETKGLADQANATAGVMQRLRGVFATLLGFITLRGALEGAKNILSLGDAAESARIKLAGLFGSQEAGNRAFAELKQLARDNAQQFEAILDAATKMKAFGLDPLDGSLQKLIDQNAKLGGSQQTLEGIILAVGQAWSKQKLQGEEILQLVERGVPVWDLLAKATGKNVQELQKLSEQGKLGRTEIKLLLDEIGRSAEGAAAKNLGLLSSIVQGLRDRVKEFFTLVSDSGALQFFKDRLSAIKTEIEGMARDGSLAAYAKRVSEALISVGKAAESGARFIIEHAGALVELAKAYAAIKFASFLVGMAESAQRMLAAAVAAKETAQAVGGLRGALASIPSSIKIAIAAVGIEAAISEWVKFAEQVKEAEAIEHQARDTTIANAEARNVLATRLQTVVALYAAYRGEVIASDGAVATASARELQAYAQRLEGARKFYAALRIERRRANDEDGAAEATARLQAYELAIDKVAARLRALDEAKKKAFGAPDADLTEALLALGVDAETAGAKITKEGEKIIANFQRVATEANASSGQVRAAFAKALDSAVTVVEIQKLEQGLRVAFESGKLSAAQYTVEAGRAAQKISEITAASQLAQGAVTGIGDAGEAASKKAIANLEAVRSTLLSVAQEINTRLAEAIRQKADDSVISSLSSQANEADKQLQLVNKQLADAKERLQETGEKGAQSFQQVEKGAEQAGDAAEELGDKAEAGAEQTGTAIGGVLGQLVAMYQKFSAISPAAAQLFKELYNGSVQTALSLGGVAKAIARAEKATDAAIENQRSAAQELTRQYAAVAEQGEAAGLAFQHATRAGSDGLRQLADDAREGRGQLSLLNQSELDELAESAERAATKVASIREEAIAAAEELAQLNRSMQDELDTRAGNEAAVLEREHQDRLAKIEELAQRAGEAGREQADQARARAEQDYRDELARIQAETKAKAEAVTEQADASIAAAEREAAARSSAAQGAGAGGARSSSGPLTIVLQIRNDQVSGQRVNLDQLDLQELVEALTPSIVREIEASGAIV